MYVDVDNDGAASSLARLASTNAAHTQHQSLPQANYNNDNVDHNVDHRTNHYNGNMMKNSNTNVLGTGRPHHSHPSLTADARSVGKSQAATPSSSSSHVHGPPALDLPPLPPLESIVTATPAITKTERHARTPSSSSDEQRPPPSSNVQPAHYLPHPFTSTPSLQARPPQTADSAPTSTLNQLHHDTNDNDEPIIID